MRFLLGLLFNNLLYKGLALLVAAVLWAAVQGSASVVASIDLRVELGDPPESLVVVHHEPIALNVQVTGSRAAVRAAERQLGNYPVSLASISEGETSITVDTGGLNLPRGAKVTLWSPNDVRVRAERISRKKVTVRADVVGTPPEGYELLGVSVTPRQVILAGARSAIRRLREIRSEPIDLGDLRETGVHEVLLATGSSLVWRAEEDSVPVRVEIRLQESVEVEGEAR